MRVVKGVGARVGRGRKMGVGGKDGRWGREEGCKKRKRAWK